jgi:hypothetical protein
MRITFERETKAEILVRLKRTVEACDVKSMIDGWIYVIPMDDRNFYLWKHDGESYYQEVTDDTLNQWLTKPSTHS